MSEEPQKPSRPSRGRTWVKGKTGTLRTGQPIAEWGWVVPRPPWEISVSNLRGAEPAMQVEVALTWFNLNLRPHDLDSDRPPQGYGLGNYGSDNYGGYSDSIPAIVALRGEFVGIIPDTVLTAASKERPGEWLWINPPPSRIAHPLSGGLDKVRREVEELRRLIEDTPIAHGGIGHNRPPNELRATPEERLSVLSDIRHIEAALPTITAADKDRLKAPIANVLAYASKMGRSALRLIAEGALKEAGKELWMYVQASVDIMQLAEHIGTSLRLFLGL